MKYIKILPKFAHLDEVSYAKKKKKEHWKEHWNFTAKNINARVYCDFSFVKIIKVSFKNVTGSYKLLFTFSA